MLSQEKASGDNAAQRLAQLARRQMNAVLQATTPPTGNVAIAALREQAMTALARGDEGRAEALLAAAELVYRSDTTANASAAADAADGLSPLTIAAQNDDRGRDLLNSRDYVGAIRLFAEAAARVPDGFPLVRAGYLIDQANAAKALDEATVGEDAGRHAAEVYHRAYASLVLSLADLCPGQPAANAKEVYEARARDNSSMIWQLRCP